MSTSTLPIARVQLDASVGSRSAVTLREPDGTSERDRDWLRVIARHTDNPNLPGLVVQQHEDSMDARRLRFHGLLTFRENPMLINITAKGRDLLDRYDQVAVADALRVLGYDVEFVDVKTSDEQRVIAAVDAFVARYKLTECEAKIVGHLARGATIGEAASLVRSSHNTCKWHVQNIYAKAQVHTLTELVLRVLLPSIA